MKTQLLFLLLSAILLAGCSSPVSTRKIEFYNPFTYNRPHRAAKMSCIWEAKQLTKKSVSMRGFQGEIIFFRDAKMEKSTAVDGTLTVYLFNADEKTTNIDGMKPEREYVFDSEALRKSVQKNKSKLISYGVWLPYDAMPGDEKNFIILAKFEGAEEDGELLPSDQIPIVLPGRPVIKAADNNTKNNPEKNADSAIHPASGTNSANGFGNYDAIRHADYNDINDFGGIQLTAYGEAMQRLQSGMTNAAGGSFSDKLVLPPSVSHQIFQTPKDSDSETSESNNNQRPKNSESTQSAPTDNVSSPAIGFGGGDHNVANDLSSNNQRFAAIGFGNGNSAANIANNRYAANNNAAYQNSLPEEMSPQRLTRFRPNVTGIGAQINQQMQQLQANQQRYGNSYNVSNLNYSDYNTAYGAALNNGNFNNRNNDNTNYNYASYNNRNNNMNGYNTNNYNANNYNANNYNANNHNNPNNGNGFSPSNFNNNEIQQVSYVASNPNLSGSQAIKQQEMHQAMARMMAEQEQRRNLNQSSAPQGFSNYNTNTFPPDQNRITVTDRYPSWGISPSQSSFQSQSSLQSQSSSQSQSSYIESDWGPALNNIPATRETHVSYSREGEGRIYR